MALPLSAASSTNDLSRDPRVEQDRFWPADRKGAF